MSRAGVAWASLGLLFVGTLGHGGAQAGKKMPSVALMDDLGRTRISDSLSGQVTILLPMYSHCPGPCLTNVASLRAALNQSDVDPAKTRVVLFSFDPAETVESLASYRFIQRLPLSWILARSDEVGTLELMEWLGSPYSRADGEYLHRNSVYVVSPDLLSARELTGGRYSSLELGLAVRAATSRGRSGFLDGVIKFGFAIFVFATVCLGIYLTHLLSRMRSYRRLNA